MRVGLLVVLLFSSSIAAWSQNIIAGNVPIEPKPLITITNAKSQQWSGGVAGEMGCRYYIDFFVRGKGTVVPDTIWIGDNCYPVHTYGGEFPNGQDVNCKLTKGKLKWNYSFFINQSESTNQTNTATNESKKDEVKPKPPEYKGAAVISFTSHHKRKLKVIPSFTRLPPVNYP